jgi:hypothetical protein
MTPVVDLPNAKNERRMDYFVFLQEPISATFIVLSVVIVAMSLRGGVSALILKKRNARLLDE